MTYDVNFSKNSLTKKLTEIVEENLQNEQFGVEELAEKVGINRSHLHRKLQETTGQSISQFIREYRLQSAMELLKNEEITASEVAYQVGFGSATYFSKSFTDFYGYPPGEAKKHSFERPKLKAMLVENERPNKKSQIVKGISIVLFLGISILLYILYGKNNQFVDLNKIDKSIAVLPFNNESDDAKNAYFVNGMMEDIRSNLSMIGDLRVISKTSTEKYRQTNLSSFEIGNELSVNYLLEGTVQKLDNQVKIHAQLIDAENDDHIWQDTYLRDISDIKEVFKIQAEIAQAIADELETIITPEEKARISSIPTDITEAYDLYLQAVFTWSGGTSDDVADAVVLLERAIQIDPEFADAYALLGFLKSQFWWFGDSEMTSAEEAYNMGMPYFEKALEIDPYNINALSYSISSLTLYRWDFNEAEKRRLILNELNPDVMWWGHLISLGRFKEALEDTEARFQFDPYSSDIWEGKIMSYYFNNREDDALHAIETALKGNFQNIHLDMDITRVYLYLEMYNKAIEYLDQFFQNYIDFKDTPRPLGFLAIAYYHTGKLDETREILERLQLRSEESSAGSPSFFITMIYAQMGEIDMAFEWLNKAYEDHEVEMYWIKVEPLFEPLRSDPRWQLMLDKIGFPE
ncbi:MAG: helix-turn-helix domain-containing protein [Cyclobacteriaceae bacterium]|nr:helix-turn-helix domain-containing protein [Cyclobacteriaceae bacterium]